MHLHIFYFKNARSVFRKWNRGPHEVQFAKMTIVEMNWRIPVPEETTNPTEPMFSVQRPRKNVPMFLRYKCFNFHSEAPEFAWPRFFPA